MNDLIKGSWAGAIINEKFICIKTYSGYRSRHSDPDGVQHITKIDADGAELGNFILDSLSHSRFILPKPRPDVWIHPEATFDAAFYDKDQMEKNYADWKEMIMSMFNYKTEQALFKQMLSCGIERKGGEITITPSHHVKLDHWNGDGITDEDNVVIPDDSTPIEIGSALRLAFSRCIG
ncbi:contact-dependent growth inhibition system immunity protein [Acerihabitans sp. KWT182]|uniref:Contact-dependent growth inhibition system immunity protein n=1 Tax=Acerihabitans sp. KWT182 TaxID=3157919 RepID=A0AAU7QDD2_9GAMM